MITTGRRTSGPTTANWPVKRSRGGLVGLAAAAAFLVLAGVALVWAAGQPVGTPLLLGFGVAAVAGGLGVALAVAAIGYFRLRYQLEPGKLVIRWSGPPETVMLDEVDGIYAGQRVGPLRKVRGWNWPGYHVGEVRSRAHGSLRVFCTDRSVDALSVIVTPSRTLVLSPFDPPGFRRELIRRIETNEVPAERLEPARRAAHSFPDPAVAGLIGVACALLLASLLAILAGFPRLPEMIALQVDPAGRPGPLSPRGEIFNLPLLGAALLALNLLLAFALRGRERAATVLLCGTASLLEVVILLAALRLLP